MAKMHGSFIKFDEALVLSSSKKEEIRKSRDAIRDDIKMWMSENGKGTTKFCMQGSFSMNTTITPIDGLDYDIDDGLYLCAYKDEEKDNWPTCSTVHSWVKLAVEDRTSYDPIYKDSCVRVPYAHGYHVDIPIYIMKDGHAHLARKSTGWEINDAKEFKDWLNEKNPSDGQLKRIIRYLKSWKDYCGVDLKGVAITVLAGENYERAAGKDDDALRYTVENIHDELNRSFRCIKPLAPGDDFFERYSNSEADRIKSSFESLLATLKEAHLADSAREASETLRNVLGDKFPQSSDETKAAASVIATSTPGILKRDERFG